MNTEFVSVFRLPLFQQFLEQRESEINMLVNSLRIADVKEDDVFQASGKRIKDQILLKPVALGDINVAEPQYDEKFTFQISVPFSGSSDIITHARENASFSNTERGIIMPSWGNTITLFISLQADEPDEAKEEAERLLIPTRKNIEGNNATVERWNRTIEAQIDQALTTRRSNLIRNYGG